MKFNSGDRVVIVNCDPSDNDYTYCSESCVGVVGTVIWYGKNNGGDDVVDIIRDDGQQGGGTDYIDEDENDCSSWRCWVGNVEHVNVRTKMKEETHIMGLSPESINWDAHRAFTRDMK